MAYEYKKHKMVDGKRYGPTDDGWYYQPADYHGKVSKVQSKKGKKAKEKEHKNKTHWVLTKAQQYDVFWKDYSVSLWIARICFQCLITAMW